MCSAAMTMSDLSLEETARKTANLVQGMMSYWKDAHGWAPTEAAVFLNKSMLEWQGSLAKSLDKWTGPLDDGELILAWSNVGAIVEGQLKLFLSVYYNDYLGGGGRVIKTTKGSIRGPDEMTLEPLRVFFKKNIWSVGVGEDWDAWIELVQFRRNAIHAFKSRTIGTPAELHASLRKLRKFVHFINDRLPYPDQVSVPQEC